MNPEINQSMTISFKDGSSLTIPKFHLHQIGGGCLQVAFEDTVFIYNIDTIDKVVIKQEQVDPNVIDV